MHRKEWITRLFRVALVFLVVGLEIGILLYFVIKNQFFLPCLFHEVTGLYCPGCGMTRAMIALLSFDVVSCFRYNALLIPLIILGCYYLIQFLRYYIWHHQVILLNQVFSKKFVYGMLAIVLLFGLFRNLGWFCWI